MEIYVHLSMVDIYLNKIDLLYYLVLFNFVSFINFIENNYN